jgi:autotransporter-associated beta strand protein
MSPMKSLLRVGGLGSSLSLLFSCVWFTQKQANPTMMPSSKLLVLPSQAPSKSVMPGSKSGTLIMPDSKSYTGGTTISSGALQIGKTPPPAKP